MSKKLFSKADQELLSKNKYVKHVSDKAITYSDDFKRLFIDFYLSLRTLSRMKMLQLKLHTEQHRQ